MAHHFKAGEGALWAQVNGPNTVPVYLGCHQVGDIDQPEGDVELIYCPDPTGPNRFIAVGSLQGAAGAITTTVTTDVTDELDQLERARCPFTLFVHMTKTGHRGLFTNFDRTFVLENARITNKGLTGLTARSPDDNARSEMTFDLSAEKLLRLLEPAISQQSHALTTAINDITFCNDQQCRTDDNVAEDTCQSGFAATDAASGVTADILVTTDGAAWAATAADPFQIDEHAIAIECFNLSRDNTRVVVADGSTNAGPPEIAYTDDSGANWTVVDIGVAAQNADFVPARFSLFALDRNNIWCGSSGGFIYKSTDAAVTWTAVESGVIHAGNWNAIKFFDEDDGWAAGDANVIAKTTDGGASWSSITGPTAMAANNITNIEVIDKNRVWIGYDSGHLYYTLDGGVNGNLSWTAKAFTGSGVGEVRDLKMLSETQGYMLTDDGGPIGTVQWTIDGGYTWSPITTPTNAGVNALFLCDEWKFFVCGEVVGGIGFIAKGAV